MVFHVASFFVFLPKFPFGCPLVAHLTFNVPSFSQQRAA